MAKIISIPPPAAQAGGLSNSLVAGLVGDRVVDAFLVADNNLITGQLLRDLIGPAFDEHRSLQTMNAVAASATARTAVRNSSVAMTAVGAVNMAIGKFAAGEAGLDPTAWADMTAVAASATANTAIFASATARIAVYDSTVAWDALRLNATAQTHMISIGLLHNASWEGGAPWTYPPTVTSTTRVVVVRFRSAAEGHLAQSRDFAQTVFFNTTSSTLQNVFLRMTGAQHRSATSSAEMRYIIMQ